MPETSPNPPNDARGARLMFRNWLSLAGLMVSLGSLFSFLLLFVLDSIAHVSNPYIGVLTYLVAPGFLILGLALIATGILWHRHRRKSAGPIAALQVDLSRARDRRILALFLAGSVGFLFVSALGSYKTYQFTESVQFCGETCHTVMQPEFVAYQHGSHARVACAECHIGPGATWFVRSKLSGTYQVYATLFGKYPRPIPTPVHNLRPAQETCEHCHWPRKFVGNLDQTFHYFLGDKANTPYDLRLLLKVGGGDPTHGPVGGIHWHMSVANRIEYLATDPQRQKIPWVRLTDSLGVVTVFHTSDFTNQVSSTETRRMDCMDCHNRPAHRFASPGSAVNLALALHELDRSLPFIKTNAIYALTRPYNSDAEADQGIASFLAKQYPPTPALHQAVQTVQTLYTNNFFPKMKSDWLAYPDNIGHMRWPGCFRCHDGNHKSEDGRRVISNSCDTCHTILSQGNGPELERISAKGEAFKHPGGDIDEGFKCTDCHGGPP